MHTLSIYNYMVRKGILTLQNSEPHFSKEVFVNREKKKEQNQHTTSSSSFILELDSIYDWLIL